jgi:tripartite-type tricarboxylate transporter receptor subunit TctC
MKGIARRIAGFACILAVPLGAQAQSFPTKPLRIVVAFAPGGSTDLAARALVPKLQEALGQPVVVENRPGAGGAIGVDAAAKAPPDGTLVAVSAPGALTINMHFSKLPYDALRDVTPVTRLARGPLVVGVNAALPIQSISELIAYAKASPGKVSFSTTGPNNLSYLAGELLKHMTGIQMVAVPYKGASPGSAAIASGEVQIGFMDTTGVQPFVQSGKVRLIAICEATRSGTLPNLPTIAESGVPGYAANSWLALVASGATPGDILAKLNSEFSRVLKLPEVREAYNNAGLEAAPNTPDEMKQILRSDYERWRVLISEAGIKGD